MKLLTPTPNFSVIIPGGCPGKCSFCFWKPVQPMGPRLFKDRLIEICEALPECFQQVSITGGEPTCNPNLITYLKVLRQRFDKIVLNTTCYALGNLDLDGLVDCVNISRHHHDTRSNRRIMGNTHLSNLRIQAHIKRFNYVGIPVTLNCVITKKQDKDDHYARVSFIQMYIKQAQKLGASSVCFRMDAHDNSLAPGRHELDFKGHRAISETACPVCRTKTQLIDGMTVHWKASLIEPKELLSEDQIYELILHPDGKLTMDWAGEMQYAPGSFLQSPDEDLDDLVMAVHGVEKDKPQAPKKKTPSFKIVKPKKVPSKAIAVKKKPTPYNTGGLGYSGCGYKKSGGC